MIWRLEKKYRLYALKQGLKIFIPLSAFTFIITCIIFILSYSVRKDIIRAELIHGSSFHAGLLTSELASIKSDLNYLAQTSDVRDLLASSNFPFSYLRSKIENDFRLFSQFKEKYDQVRILNARGMELLRVNYSEGKSAVVPQGELQYKGNRYYFSDSIKLGQGEIYMSPLDLNIEKGEIEKPLKPMIRLASVVYDRRGRKTGIVLLNYLGKGLLEKFSTALHQEDVTDNKVMLLNRDGYWLFGPDRDDQWGFMFREKKERTFGRDYPEEWKAILKQRNGEIETEKGIFIFTTVYPLKKGMVSSSGSPEAVGKSESYLRKEEYFWKVVHLLPAEELSKLKKQYALFIFIPYGIALLVFIFGCLYYGYSVTQKKNYGEEREKMIGELQRAVDEVNALSGLLPICSRCKKIRDDDGYWHQVETYIGKHSDAEFSHGICPVCEEELYRDQEWYKKRKKKREEK